LIVASCISLRKTRIFTIREDVSHPVSPSRSSPRPFTTALPISSFTAECKSYRRGICTPPPASAITSHFPPSSTPPLVAEARSRYSLTRTSSSSSKRRGWKVKGLACRACRPVSPHAPCLDPHLLQPASCCVLCVRVCSSPPAAPPSSSSSSSPRSPQERRASRP
jgi:hypothetical protein